MNAARAATSGRRLWLAAYFGLCFLATNGLAVGLKTLIVEELDYPARVWFEAYVGPLHFYIVAVALAYLSSRATARRRSIGGWGCSCRSVCSPATRSASSAS